MKLQVGSSDSTTPKGGRKESGENSLIIDPDPPHTFITVRPNCTPLQGDPIVLPLGHPMRISPLIRHSAGLDVEKIKYSVSIAISSGSI